MALANDEITALNILTEMMLGNITVDTLLPAQNGAGNLQKVKAGTLANYFGSGGGGGGGGFGWVNAASYGLATGNTAAQNNTAIAAALAAMPATTWPTYGGVMVVPPGAYNITKWPAMSQPNITIISLGAVFTCTQSPAFDLGADVYLTDLAQGLYTFMTFGVTMNLPAAGTGIKNRGVRKLMLNSGNITGGAVHLDTEGAYAGSIMRDYKLAAPTTKAIRINQRNNLFKFEQVAVLAATAGAISIDGSSIIGGASGGENKNITFNELDIEGCGNCFDIKGDTSGVRLDTFWSEGNTGYYMKVFNNDGHNKYVISLVNGELTGAGVDIIVGNDAAGTLIDGFSITDSELVDVDVVLIAAQKVTNFWHRNLRQSGTSVITQPAPELTDIAGPPQRRYIGTPVQPWGTAAAGQQGDDRYSDERGFKKTALGWMRYQLERWADDTNVLSLPTGATPNVAGYGAVATHNTGGPVTITNLLGGKPSQRLSIGGGDGGNTTIQDAGNLHLAGNFTFGDYDSMVLVCIDGTHWREESRSNN